MKNIFNLKAIQRIAGIIVLVAVIGFSFAACGDDDDGGGTGGGDDNSNQIPGGGEGGTFTLTNIPSEFNGKYVSLYGSNEQLYGSNGPLTIYGGLKELDTYASVISNGSVIIPLWTRSNNGNGDWVRYYGNDSCSVSVFLVEICTISFTTNVGNPITFVNGSATRSWSEGFYRAITSEGN